MSTRLEERLGAALRARAELVQSEHLRSLEAPPTVTAWRRPALVGLAAAAAVAVFALPLAGWPGDSSRPGPPPVDRPTVARVVEPLPALFPEVSAALGVDRPFRFSFSAPQPTDRAVLRGEGAGDWAEAGSFELVVTLAGQEFRAGLPAGGRPVLLPGLIRAKGDAPAFAVTQEGGDAEQMTVFTFWNGALVALAPQGDVPLGSGFRVEGGRTRAYATWLSTEGLLYTRFEVDPAQGRWRVWAWDVDGMKPKPVDLGEVCLDFEARPVDYRRC